MLFYNIFTDISRGYIYSRYSGNQFLFQWKRLLRIISLVCKFHTSFIKTEKYSRSSNFKSSHLTLKLGSSDHILCNVICKYAVNHIMAYL